MISDCPFHEYISACDSGRDHVSACFNTIRYDVMNSSMHTIYTFNADHTCPCTAHLAAHCINIIG
ncbi:hypothetical protein D3C78_1611900 [compost metagenome]